VFCCQQSVRCFYVFAPEPLDRLSFLRGGSHDMDGGAVRGAGACGYPLRWPAAWSHAVSQHPLASRGWAGAADLGDPSTSQVPVAVAP